MNIHDLYYLWRNKNFHNELEVLQYASLLQQIDKTELIDDGYIKYCQLENEIYNRLEACL